MPNDSPALAGQLTGIGDYELLTPLGGREVHLRFKGPLEGREVTWDAHIQALRAVPDRPRQFIEVEVATKGRARVRVGLNVQAIHAATVIKAIIMLRQWRRLKPGRHEYGPPVETTMDDT